MPVFHDAGRSQQARAAGDKHGLRVAVSQRLELLEPSGQNRRDAVERQLRVNAQQPFGQARGDVYKRQTKTWAKKPVPFLANIGWKATNATIFGIGGQSTRFGGRFFGGLGIPLPIGKGIVAVPSAGFTQEPGTSKGCLLYTSRCV